MDRKEKNIQLAKRFMQANEKEKAIIMRRMLQLSATLLAEVIVHLDAKHTLSLLSGVLLISKDQKKFDGIIEKMGEGALLDVHKLTERLTNIGKLPNQEVSNNVRLHLYKLLGGVEQKERINPYLAEFAAGQFVRRMTKLEKKQEVLNDLNQLLAGMSTESNSSILRAIAKEFNSLNPDNLAAVCDSIEKLRKGKNLLGKIAQHTHELDNLATRLKAHFRKKEGFTIAKKAIDYDEKELQTLIEKILKIKNEADRIPIIANMLMALNTFERQRALIDTQINRVLHILHERDDSEKILAELANRIINRELQKKVTDAIRKPPEKKIVRGGILVHNKGMELANTMDGMSNEGLRATLPRILQKNDNRDVAEALEILYKNLERREKGSFILGLVTELNNAPELLGKLFKKIDPVNNQELAAKISLEHGKLHRIKGERRTITSSGDIRFEVLTTANEDEVNKIADKGADDIYNAMRFASDPERILQDNIRKLASDIFFAKLVPRILKKIEFLKKSEARVAGAKLKEEKPVTRSKGRRGKTIAERLIGPVPTTARGTAWTLFKTTVASLGFVAVALAWRDPAKFRREMVEGAKEVHESVKKGARKLWESLKPEKYEGGAIKGPERGRIVRKSAEEVGGVVRRAPRIVRGGIRLSPQARAPQFKPKQKKPPHRPR